MLYQRLGPVFWEDDGPFHIMGQAITGLGSDFARWATQTEKYLTQLLHNPTTGRGSKISIYQAPLVDHRQVPNLEERVSGLLGQNEDPDQHCASVPNPPGWHKLFSICWTLFTNMLPTT